MQDLTPFTGVWIGINNNIKYEITFKEGIRKVELNGIKYTIELIFASSVKWFKNEKLIREFNADAPQSILEGIISETNPLFLSWFNYYDEEKGYNGSGTLTIGQCRKSTKGKTKARTELYWKKQRKDGLSYIVRTN